MFMEQFLFYRYVDDVYMSNVYMSRSSSDMLLLHHRYPPSHRIPPFASLFIYHTILVENRFQASQYIAHLYYVYCQL